MSDNNKFFTDIHEITDNTIEGWTTLIVTLLIMGGLMLMSIGLIGEYLGRMYLAINKSKL